ncbi:siderophore-interacting protein [Streptomyces albipurpureus]|uniref:Siderophore-interacting protein n=1 Tax=Streptomyces albipurpureus TaxID=2897419 RepID=A0ABT0UMK9_9ACTN|nr:siderophore-interacting protein [Streptomyces sp. CWNU-1]MCM2389669.1 siderophore-interacting protein [Streptomyces sp. CWNU-1]
MSGAPLQEHRDEPRDRQHPRGRVAAHHREGSGITRIPYPIGIRTAEVLRKEYLNERMLRLTVGGPALDGFHSYQADDHVKIVFPDPQGTLRLPTVNEGLTLDWPRPLPTTRKYTVRRFDATTGELDLDFVIHPGGTASEWAVAAEPGDPVSLAGPPGAKAFPHTYDHYVFAVDATAIPATARWLEQAPDDVSAHLVIETGSIAEHTYPLAQRDGVRITRLVREGDRSHLAMAVRSLFLPAGRGFLFAAGEAEDIKPLRAWAKGRMDALFTGYWKRGVAGLED